MKIAPVDMSSALIAVALKGGEIMFFETPKGWRLFVISNVTGEMFEATPAQARSACASLSWLLQFTVIKGLGDIIADLTRLLNRFEQENGRAQKTA